MSYRNSSASARQLTTGYWRLATGDCFSQAHALGAAREDTTTRPRTSLIPPAASVASVHVTGGCEEAKPGCVPDCIVAVIRG